MKCARCGRSYPPGTQVCPEDGTDLISDEQYQNTAYAPTHHSSPGTDTAGALLPQPPGREGSSPDATLGYSENRAATDGDAEDREPAGRILTPGPPGSAGYGSSPGTGRDLSSPNAGGRDIQISPGDMINEYRITGKVGEGGMGSVYEGVQPVIGKRVAIKVLLREFASNPEVVNRFIQEARAANQAQSRHIVDIFSFGELCDGRHYFVMEYLNGKSLREVLDEQKVVPFDDAYAILSCVAKGLAAAHSVGIIHRDIKPENLVVLKEQDGSISAKVLDFGIAKLQGNTANPSFVTRTGAALGTPYYMSPEQCRGQDVDHRTDIYAMGIIIFEMFTGTLPFKAKSYIELVNKHLFASPPEPTSLNPRIPRQLESFILRCIAKNPAERPQSMQQFRSELAELVPLLHDTRPSAAHPIPVLTPDPRGTAERVAPPAKKSNLGSMLGVLGAVLVLLGGGVVGAYVWYAKQKRPPDVVPDKVVAAEVDAAAGVATRPLKPIVLTLRTTPPGATVFVDETRQENVTPLKLTVAPGKRRLKVVLDGHVAIEEVLELRPDETEREKSYTFTSASRATPALATLEVVTGHRRAVYYLGDTRVGQGPRLALKGYAPGSYTLKIVAPGRMVFSETVALKPGAVLAKEVVLRRKGGRRPPAKKGPEVKKPAVDDPEATLDPFRRKKKN